MDYALSALRDAYLSSLPVMDKRNRPISTSNTNFTFSRYFGLKVVIDCSWNMKQVKFPAKISK